MTTYYIDSVGGNNGWAGTTPATAWLDETNINSYFAAGTFVAGDNILFFAGQTHSLASGSIRVRNSSGSSGNPITFGPYYGGTAATVPVLQKGIAGVWAYIIGLDSGDSGGDFIKVEGLRLDGNSLMSATDKGAIWIDGAVEWELDRLEMYDSGAFANSNGIKCRGDGKVTVRRCLIHGFYDEGIYGGTAGDTGDNAELYVYDSMVYDTGGEAVDLKDGVQNSIFERCVFAANGTRDTQVVSFGGTNNTFRDCRIVATASNTEGIYMGLYSSPGTNYVYNCLIDGPCTYGMRFNGGTNWVYNTTHVNNDYSIRSTSGTNHVNKAIMRNWVTAQIFPGSAFASSDIINTDPSFITPIGPVPYVTRLNDGVAEGYGWWEAR